MQPRDERLFLEDIRNALDRITEYTKVGRDGFAASLAFQDAVIRNLEIVGEAVKQLSDQTRAGAPEVPWGAFAGLRDRLIHGYFAVDLEIVWDTIQEDLPVLHRAVARLLNTIDPD